MPPKKCLQESPEREDPRDSYKNSHLKYGEEMLKHFDMEQEHPAAKKAKKRKVKDDENYGGGGSTKTPRIVIKFSKGQGTQNKPNNGPPDTGQNLNSFKIKT